MSTTTTVPELLEPIAICDYAIACCGPDGGEAQHEDLTVEEYGALRRHLAKLRGLISEEGSTETKVADAPAEGDTATEDEPEPQTMTARMAADAFQRCISNLESLRSKMLLWQGEEATYIVDDLAGATLLDSILNDWYCGGFDQTFPKENRLLGAINGNLGL